MGHCDQQAPCPVCFNLLVSWSFLRRLPMIWGHMNVLPSLVPFSNIALICCLHILGYFSSSCPKSAVGESAESDILPYFQKSRDFSTQLFWSEPDPVSPVIQVCSFECWLRRRQESLRVPRMESLFFPGDRAWCQRKSHTIHDKWNKGTASSRVGS